MEAGFAEGALDRARANTALKSRRLAAESIYRDRVAAGILLYPPMSEQPRHGSIPVLDIGAPTQTSMDSV